MRYYYDQEFHEDGSTIDLISIGIHAADGREYYAVNREMKWGPITKHGWLMRNVVPYLPQPQEPGPLPQLDWDDPAMKGRKQIADEVLWFLTAVPEEPELWAYYAAFDHVRLAWLWGTMIQMPRRIPMFTNDIRQEQHRLGNPDLPQQSSAQHHALADARHNRVMHEYLIEYERRRGR